MSSNQELIKLINAEARKVVRQENAGLIKQIEQLNKKIQELEFNTSKKLNFMMSQQTASTEPDAKQMQLVKTEVSKQVSTIIEKEIAPQLAKLKTENAWLQEKTCDGTQLVTDYRHRVWGSAQKQIMSGNAHDDFQATTFAFTDND